MVPQMHLTCVNFHNIKPRQTLAGVVVKEKRAGDRGREAFLARK